MPPVSGHARVLAGVCGVLLSVSATGCESLQRKFTRKSKRPAAVVNPILTFEDYTQAMTPLDRYRKHALLFDYWNDELLTALQERSLNAKRCRRTSGEALAELTTLQGFLMEAMAAQLEPLIQERARIHQQLSAGTLSAHQAMMAWRALEAQKREVQRTFYWRDVQDALKAVAAE
jgi:hypothetical protein